MAMAVGASGDSDRPVVGAGDAVPTIEMPELSKALSKRARRGKWWLLFWARISLWALFIGALLSAANQVWSKLDGGIAVPRMSIGDRSVSIVAAVAVITYLFAGVMVVARQILRPDLKWYPSRATSEDIKSRAWMYAVGGEPYAIPAGSGAPDPANEAFRDFIRRCIERIATEAERGNPSLVGETGDNITPSMQALRGMPLATRRTAYAAHRIWNQRDKFYAPTARKYRAQAWIWRALLYVSFGAGVVVAALQALNVLPFDLIGVTTTATSVITSWLLLAQYETLSEKYKGMVRLLDSYHESCTDEKTVWTEENWARFAGEVEGALTAEHAEWLRTIRLGLDAGGVHAV